MTSIRKAPINVQNVITYDVVIGVSNPDLKLFPGMTANVKILVNQRPNVLKVPNAALRYHPASEPAGGRCRHGRRARRRAGEGGLGAGRERQAAARRGHDGRHRRHLHRSNQRRPEGRRPRDCRGAGEDGARVGRQPGAQRRRAAAGGPGF